MKIAIIGAGASGLFAAVCAAEKKAQVTVFEHGAEAGKKLLMTGNGKCNLSNQECTRNHYYSDSDEENTIGGVLEAFTPDSLERWFWKKGMLLREKRGYWYPYSEQAATVRDVLLRSCRELGVDIRYGVDCYGKIEVKKKGGFVIDGESFDRLFLACGGKSYKATGSDGSGYEIAKSLGHQIIEPKPALVQLHTNDPDWNILAGVRAQGIVWFPEGEPEYKQLRKKPGKKRVNPFAEEGELQFTEYGLSGIPTFQISRRVVNKIYEAKQSGIKKPVMELKIDLIPAFNKNQVRGIIIDRFCNHSGGTLYDSLIGLVNDKIIAYALKKLNLENASAQPYSGYDKGFDLADTLASFFTEMPVTIVGSHKLEAAQVTQGGIPFTEVDAHLQSKLVPGLFFTGEILDVDGRCGGYNLQWAWSSAFTAVAEALQ